MQMRLQGHQRPCNAVGSAQLQQVQKAALDALDPVKSAIACDVGGLARPRRNGAGSRHDQHLTRSLPCTRVERLAVAEQVVQPSRLGHIGPPATLYVMPVTGPDGHQRRRDRSQLGGKLLAA